jgi:hypothetical protein
MINSFKIIIIIFLLFIRPQKVCTYLQWSSDIIYRPNNAVRDVTIVIDTILKESDKRQPASVLPQRDAP